MFDKFKKAGKLLAEAAVEGYEDTKTATMGAYSGAKAKLNGATIITDGTKEVHLTKAHIEQLHCQIEGTCGQEGEFEILLDDSATDDGYTKVRVTIHED